MPSPRRMSSLLKVEKSPRHSKGQCLGCFDDRPVSTVATTISPAPRVTGTVSTLCRMQRATRTTVDLSREQLMPRMLRTLQQSSITITTTPQ